MTETNFVFESVEQAREAFEFYYYQPKRANELLRYAPILQERISEETRGKFFEELRDTFVDLVQSYWVYVEKTLREEGHWNTNIPEIVRTSIWNMCFALRSDLYHRLEGVVDAARAWQETPLGGCGVIEIEKAVVLDNYHKFLEGEKVDSETPYEDLCAYMAQKTDYWIDDEKCRKMFEKFATFVDITTAVEMVEDVCKIIMESNE